VAAMTERGFAGNWRYLVVPAALALVLAAAGVGWTATVMLPRLGAAARWLRPAVLGLIAAIAATYLLLSVPQTFRTYAFEVRVNEETDLVLDRLGDQRLRRCGRIYVNPFLLQRVAWELDRPAKTIAATYRAPADASAAVLRTRLTPEHPLLPRPEPAGGGQPVVLRTDHWRMELRCDGDQAR
jgi:hypothetical protein